MAVRVSGEGAPSSGRLVFHFHNKKPVHADDLGKFLVAVARDYHNQTGRRLVVTSVELGTVTTVLKDAVIAAAPYVTGAVEVAKAIKAGVEFASTLRSLLERLRNGPAKRRLEKMSAGQTSLDAFLKVVGKMGGEGEFEYSSESGKEKIKARVTSKEALEIQRHLKEERRLRHKSGDSSVPELIEADDPLSIVDRLSSMGESELEAVIKMLVPLMQSRGLSANLDAIAGELELRGHHRAAQAIRAANGLRARSVLPPITHG